MLQVRPLYELRCPSGAPACTRPWLGREHSLFVYSNYCIMGLGILYAYINQFGSSARKLREFWDDMTREYRHEARPPAAFCSEAQFRRV